MVTKPAITLAFALAAVASSLDFTHSARADDFIGGDGGSGFGNINCPPHRAVVGLIGRSGNVIDTIQLICGRGRGDPETTDDIDPRHIGPSNGGGPISAMCPTFAAATSIQVNVREFRGHVVVSQIILHCQATLDGSSEVSRTFGGGGGDDAGSHECPANTYIGGFAGRSGTFVDALGISVCRNRSSLN
jgi:hypothetical protein